MANWDAHPNAAGADPWDAFPDAPPVPVSGAGASSVPPVAPSLGANAPGAASTPADPWSDFPDAPAADAPSQPTRAPAPMDTSVP